MQNKIPWCLAAVIFSSIFFFGYTELRNLKRKHKQFDRFFAQLEKRNTDWLQLERGHTDPSQHLGSLAIPAALQNVPFAEEEGLVLDAKRIAIRGVRAAHNASMIEEGDGYLLFFRYELFDASSGRTSSRIGYARLNERFEQTQEEFQPIDTGSPHSEDPRVVRVGDALYLVFNDLQPCGMLCRTMRIGRLNLRESKLDYVTNLDLQIKPIEKNWVPFEYIENGKPSVYLEYYLTPHKVLKLPDPSISEMVAVFSPPSATYQKLGWPPLWGAIRGGATARKIDDQYVSFFHSFFTDFNGIVWYVMGAYAFEDTPPFRITALSKHPILFKTIYDTPPMSADTAYKRVIFPGSFLPAVRDGKEVIHLVCGENDCAIKIITLDKQALLNSLRKI